MESIFLIEDFVDLKIGEPFRLFPFGKLVKGGKATYIGTTNNPKRILIRCGWILRDLSK